MGAHATPSTAHAMQRLSPTEVHDRIAYIESLRSALGDAQTDAALVELRQEIVARALGRPATPTADLAVTAREGVTDPCGMEICESQP